MGQQLVPVGFVRCRACAECTNPADEALQQGRNRSREAVTPYIGPCRGFFGGGQVTKSQVLSQATEHHPSKGPASEGCNPTGNPCGGGETPQPPHGCKGGSSRCCGFGAALHHVLGTFPVTNRVVPGSSLLGPVIA